ncbi:MAG: M20 metallopeptidase family protein [Actinomycetota bacterium]
MRALLDASDAVLSDVVAMRRRIHSEPELGLELPRTQHAVLESLAGLGLDVRAGTTMSSVVADLDGAAPGPTILLRADMDALPIPEDTDVAFASTVPGAMHACGHDAHVAMLVGAARVLAARRDELAGTIRFAFQPGEEGFHGARSMIAEGALDDPHVDAVFALHVSPNLPSGSIWTKGGALMASADAIDITISGKGGHASTPYLANDPMPVAAEIVQALQVFVTRRIDTFDPAVVTIASIHGGTTTNVIPESIRMFGTVRAVSNGSRTRALEGIERVATNIAAAHEMTATVQLDPGYPPTINDEDAAQFMLRIAGELLAPKHAGRMPAPLMGAEDFSYMLAQRPGALAFLGVCPPGVRPADAHACHSNRMTIDEDALRVGVAFHCALATGYLAAHGELAR